MGNYKTGDRVVVIGPSTTGWIIPSGTVATVSNDERYGHVRLRADGYPSAGPDWQYPLGSVEPA